MDDPLDDYTYPPWALALGWMVVIICLGWLPYIFFVEICRRGTWNIIKQARLPHAEWGPAREEHRQLSNRYTSNIHMKNLSMQTLTSIDSIDLNSDLFVKKLSNKSITSF